MLQFKSKKRPVVWEYYLCKGHKILKKNLKQTRNSYIWSPILNYTYITTKFSNRTMEADATVYVSSDIRFIAIHRGKIMKTIISNTVRFVTFETSLLTWYDVTLLTLKHENTTISNITIKNKGLESWTSVLHTPFFKIKISCIVVKPVLFEKIALHQIILYNIFATIHHAFFITLR